MTIWRYEEVANKYLSVAARSGPEWMTNCPGCSGSDCLQFNVEKGLFNCFSCGFKGTAKTLVRKMGEVWSEPGASVEVLQMKLDALVNPTVLRRSDPIPEATLLRYGRVPHRYWIKRGFTRETIKAFDLGYDALSSCCTIPYRSPEGSLLGVILRRTDGEFPKYRYPKGFDRAGSLFGSWKIDGPEVALVEGSLDAISCWQAGVPALAQYGSSISRGQIKLLLRLGIRRVVLMYDNDAAGHKAVEVAHEMLDGSGVLIRDVQYDDGDPSDPGEMSGEQIREFFSGRVA